MSRELTASDRASLIRLASSLPAGSEERRAILSGLRSASPDLEADLEKIRQKIDGLSKHLGKGDQAMPEGPVRTALENLLAARIFLSNAIRSNR